MIGRISSVVFFLLLFVSCSLKYTEEEVSVKGIPEIVFTNAKYLRYEEGIVSAKLYSDELEQYRNDNALYGKNVFFNTFDKSGIISAEGSCDFLSANTSNDKYTLLDNIKIKSFENNIEINAQSLKWDGKTEQLISGSDDSVTIIKDSSSQDDEKNSNSKMIIQGSGFSASGLTRSFKFEKNISGIIKSSKKNNVDEKEENIK